MHRHPVPRPSLGRRLHVHPLPSLGRLTLMHHWLHGVHSVLLLGRSARVAVVLGRGVVGDGSGVAALHLLLLLGGHAAGWSLHGVGVHGLGHCV